MSEIKYIIDFDSPAILNENYEILAGTKKCKYNKDKETLEIIIDDSNRRDVAKLIIQNKINKSVYNPKDLIIYLANNKCGKKLINTALTTLIDLDKFNDMDIDERDKTLKRLFKTIYYDLLNSELPDNDEYDKNIDSARTEIILNYLTNNL